MLGVVLGGRERLAEWTCSLLHEVIVCLWCSEGVESVLNQGLAADDAGEFVGFLLVLAMAGMAGRLPSRLAHANTAWLQLLFATPVVLWCGWPLLQRAAQSLRSRHFNMFTLIGLGVAVAFGFSVLATLSPAISR